LEGTVVDQFEVPSRHLLRGTEENHKENLSKDARGAVEIRTGDLPNKSQKRYRLNKQTDIN
jgi:hypothetical protein